jgi:hypothetical protein
MDRTAIAELNRLAVLDPKNADNLSEIVGGRLTLASALADLGDVAGARAELADARSTLAGLMTRPIPKRVWRLGHQGRIAALQARLAASPAEAAAARSALAAYLADVTSYEHQGSEIPAENLLTVADAEIALGDSMQRAGQPQAAEAAWRDAAARLRPQAEHLIPAAMTTVGQADLRLGSPQDARAWADRVLRTSYRHPAFADLQQRLGPTQQAGEASRL